MKKRLISAFRRNEVYVVAGVMGIVFVAAMFVAAVFLRNSMAVQNDDMLSQADLKRVFAVGYLRFREDDGTPYLKVELHNGTLWWIRRIEFDFDGITYTVKDPHEFKPLNFGAVRCALKQKPPSMESIEYDLKIDKAYGYPPADGTPNPKSAAFPAKGSTGKEASQEKIL